jgi:hypothetical protein
VPTPRLPEFAQDIVRAKDLVGLGQAIGTMTNGVVDASDLYRGALVQAVAAWDRYMHGVVLDRAVEIILGQRMPGAATRFGLPLHSVAAIATSPDIATREVAARTYVAERLALETYQRPEDVGGALAMVGIQKIWSTAFANAETAKLGIGLVVTRRNGIVHACDYDPSTPGSPLPLTDADALYAIQVIDDGVRAIDPYC